MKETVKIVATEKMQKLAQTAVEIQDASNPVAVANELVKSMKYWTGIVDSPLQDGQKYCGSDMAAQNPVTAAILNKLEHLAHMEQSSPHGDVLHYHKCIDLAEGKDVEVEIEFHN